jgi:hypothetical protein
MAGLRVSCVGSLEGADCHVQAGGEPAAAAARAARQLASHSASLSLKVQTLLRASQESSSCPLLQLLHTCCTLASVLLQQEAATLLYQLTLAGK